MKLAMNRDDGSGKVWTDLWSDFGSPQPASEYSRTLEGSFFIYEPSVNVEVAILRWLGVRAGVSYVGMAGNSWKLDDRYDVTGVPDNIKSQGFKFNTGIFVGTFIF